GPPRPLRKSSRLELSAPAATTTAFRTRIVRGSPPGGSTTTPVAVLRAFPFAEVSMRTTLAPEQTCAPRAWAQGKYVSSIESLRSRLHPMLHRPQPKQLLMFVS